MDEALTVKMVKNDAKLSQTETIHDALFVGVVPSEPVHAVDEIPDAEVSKNEIQLATRSKAICAKSVEEFAGVTLACEDNQLDAQKPILKAPSTILKAEKTRTLLRMVMVERLVKKFLNEIFIISVIYQISVSWRS